MESLTPLYQHSASASVSAAHKAPAGRLVRRVDAPPAVAEGAEQPRYSPGVAAVLVRILPYVVAAGCFVGGMLYMVRLPSGDEGVVALDGEVDDTSALRREALEQIAQSYALLRVEPFETPSSPDVGSSELFSVAPLPVANVPLALERTRPSEQELTTKVLRIIKEHAPRHRDARALAEAIVQESAAQEYDPLFVAAVIKSESTFNAMARSHKGAQGLMQLMPKTGAWLASISKMQRGALTDPGYNLKLGISYLKQLEQGYGGDRVFTLIAYNWGPGRVESAADGKRRVPPEVLTYAIRILNDYRRWRSEAA